VNNRVVLDTNIIISAAISGHGNPAKIIELVSVGIIEMYYSDEILSEYEEALSRERFEFSPEKQKAAIELISETGILLDPEKSNIQIPDMDDIIFYDAAKSANAILVTGNTKHYPDDDLIMTPAEFIRLTSDV